MLNADYIVLHGFAYSRAYTLPARPQFSLTRCETDSRDTYTTILTQLEFTQHVAFLPGTGYASD